MRDAQGVPFRIADLARDSFSGRERAVLAEVYRDPFVGDPAATYTLLRLRFDHTFTVNDTIAPPGWCADRNRTIYLAITRASWLDVNQVEHPFPYGREFVIWNPDGTSQGRDVVACNPADETPSLLAGTLSPASTLPECDVPVPAERATWGRLKSAYR